MKNIKHNLKYIFYILSFFIIIFLIISVLTPVTVNNKSIAYLPYYDTNNSIVLHYLETEESNITPTLKWQDVSTIDQICKLENNSTNTINEINKYPIGTKSTIKSNYDNVSCNDYLDSKNSFAISINSKQNGDITIIKITGISKNGELYFTTEYSINGQELSLIKSEYSAKISFFDYLKHNAF